MLVDLSYARWLLVGFIGMVGCRRVPEPSPSGVEPQPQALSTPQAAPPPFGAPQTVPSRDGPGFPRAGWRKRVVEDEGPLCIGATYYEVDRADSIEKVRKQKLQAGMPVAFETYGPGCINEACVQLPTLQCSAERDGNTLVVHSRYNGYHKDDATCDQECRPVYTGCETPILEAGRYTVRYGEKTFQLKIPSTLKDPCFLR
jgi:hypothetical protein